MLVLGVTGMVSAVAGCSREEESGKPVSINVVISKGTMSPSGDRVNVVKGSAVTVTVTSDVDVLVHVHGYDKEIAARAGTPATLTFTADLVGSFEIETHDPARIIAQLVVR